MQRIISSKLSSPLSPSTVSNFIEGYAKLVRHHGCHLAWSRAGRPVIIPGNQHEQQAHLESIRTDPDSARMA